MQGEFDTAGQPVATASPSATPPPASAGPSPSTSPSPSATPTSTAPAGQPTAAPAGAPSPLQIAASALGTPPANRQQAPAGQPQPAAPQLTPEVQAQLDQLRQLQQQLPQLQQYAQMGYAAYQREQQERKAKLQQEQQAAQSKPWFGVPEFDRGLLQFLRKNPETGQVEALPGAPPDAVARYVQYADAFQKAQQDFFADPQKFLAEPIKRLAAEEAQRLIEQRFGGYRDEVTANQIIDQHSGWMIEKTPEGGQRLTQAGRLYEGYVREASQKGLRSSQDQHEYALTKTQLAYAMAQLKAAQQPAAADAAKQQFAEQAQAAQGQPSGPATPPSNPQAPPAPAAAGPRQSLRQMLSKNFDRHGITDKTLQAARN